MILLRHVHPARSVVRSRIMPVPVSDRAANGDAPDRFAIIPLPRDALVPPNAISWGSLGPIMEHISANRRAEDAIRRANRRADSIQSDYDRATLDAVEAFVGRIADMSRRLARLETARDARRELDMETAAAETLLEIPPGAPPPDPEAPAPSVPGASDDTPSTAAGLAPVPPKDEQRHGSPPPDEPATPAGDAFGDLPEGIERRVPSDLGPYFVPSPNRLKHPQDPVPPQYEQPAAVSFSA
jgi:hypothetical protein